jgi:hypothetical protein
MATGAQAMHGDVVKATISLIKPLDTKADLLNRLIPSQSGKLYIETLKINTTFDSPEK